MNIVIEGVDNTGKSTLARILSTALGMTIQPSEGPPKFEGEMKKRIDRYLEMDDTIFDRHPCVSQPIYRSIRDADHSKESVDHNAIKRFYDSRPIFIYCDPLLGRRLKGHTFNPDTDTPEHIAQVEASYDKLLMQYRQWALMHANLMHRIGDDVRRVAQMIQHRTKTFDPVRDIEEFHSKMQLIYNDPPRMLPRDLAEFRVKFLYEELNEYELALMPDIPLTAARVKSFDALIDLVYVALGTSYLHGYNFREGWRRVHAANMRKVRATGADDPLSTRKHAADVVKPDGWKAAKLEDLI